MSEKGQCPTLSDIEIRPTRPDEFRKTEELVREAFWNVYRPGCTEHFVLHCLRKDPAFVPDLDLVLTLDGSSPPRLFLCARALTAARVRSFP